MREVKDDTDVDIVPDWFLGRFYKVTKSIGSWSAGDWVIATYNANGLKCYLNPRTNTVSFREYTDYLGGAEVVVAGTYKIKVP